MKPIETEPKTKNATETSKWLEVVVQLGFNVAALYITHLVTLNIWRAMTGH